MDRGIFPHRRVNMNPITEMKRNWQKIMILADPGQSLFTKTQQHIQLLRHTTMLHCQSMMTDSCDANVK